MGVNRFLSYFGNKKSKEQEKEQLVKEAVINSASFNKIKAVGPCQKKIFELFPNDAFIVVFDQGGKVVIYEESGRNSFDNLREVVSLFGSRFFNHSVLKKEYGQLMIDFYEKGTGIKVRDIYQYELD